MKRQNESDQDCSFHDHMLKILIYTIHMEEKGKKKEGIMKKNGIK